MQIKAGGYQIQKLLGNKQLYKIEENQLDPITKFTQNIWNTIIKKFKLEEETKLLRWLAYDTKFQPGRDDPGFKRWAREGITVICTMIEKGEKGALKF